MEMIVPVTDLQTLAEQFLTLVKSSEEFIIITQEGRASGVLLGYEYYRGLLATMEEMAAPDARAKIRRAKEESAQGRTISHQEVMQRYEGILKSSES
jgi:PHD/YefM family antitoxin component YafN of YafNO toxin-antitoxin module